MLMMRREDVKMRNKIWTIVLAVCVLAVVFAGCGQQKADVVKIGLLNEMTGGNATLGTSAANGAKLAFKEINAEGGALGKQIEAVVADNKSEPAEAANAMTKLINQDKVVAVTGTFSSSNAIAAASVAEAAKVPYLAAGATNPKVTVDEKTGKTFAYIFRVCFIDPFQGTVAANFAIDNLQMKKAVILVDNSSDYSKGLADFFRKAYTDKGGEILGEEAYLQKDQDFKTILTKIKALHPEIVYVPGYYEEAGKIVKQARELDINCAFMGGDGWDSPKLGEIAGANALNGCYFTNHYSVDSDAPASKAFVEAYTKEYGQKPDALSVLGYDAAKVLVSAIQQANSLDTEKIQQALAQTKDFPAISGVTTLNETHDAFKSAVVIEMKDGKQVFKASVKP